MDLNRRTALHLLKMMKEGEITDRAILADVSAFSQYLLGYFFCVCPGANALGSVDSRAAIEIATSLS